QIDHGIFDYCGARVLSSSLLLESESADPAPHLHSMFDRGRTLFAELPEPA
ncbi:flavodoxin family protein, partial [Pseudomonas sp. TNT2022 ID609]|nr:flavodoxin family protein [Pseudomonas rubra]